jgi:DNA-binding NtrC family response regulator
MQRLLIVDDEKNIVSVLRRRLSSSGFEVDAAYNGEEAKAKLQASRFDAVLCDLVMPDIHGLDVYGWLSTLPAPPAFVLMTAYGGLLDQMPHWRRDFPVVPKPIHEPALMETLRGAMRQQELRSVRRSLSGQTWAAVDRGELQSAARTDELILVLGESGVGKTRLAREIHQLSHRAAGPFVVQSGAELTPELAGSLLFGHRRGAFTGALSDQEGAIQAARGGTLFLDEVGELELRVQGILLRFLSDRSFQRVGDPQAQDADVRIIAATNRDLREAVATGRFREDLYYRLRVVEFTVQPLRQRPQDLPWLVERLARAVAHEHRKAPLAFSPRAMRALQGYAWPGNIRQLENLIRRISATHDTNVAVEPELIGAPIFNPPEAGPAATATVDVADGDPAPIHLALEERDDLPPLTPWHGQLQRYLEVLEYRQVLLQLRESDASQASTARALGYHRPSLLHRLKIFKAKYGAWPPL